MARAYWLLKSEPEVYPFSQLVTEKKTLWTGVRNHEARNNLARMAKSDLVLFYHSHDVELVGVARVTRTARRDPTSEDPRWVAVEIAAVKALVRPVPLAAIRADRTLATLKLLTHTRLSVMAVEPAHFARLLAQSHTRLPRSAALKPAKPPAPDGRC